jgi:hypothetical protein
MHWSKLPNADEVKKRIREKRALQIMPVRTQESRGLMSRKMKGNRNFTHGKKHWNWKGGITPINRLIRTSKEYKEWRKAVFERDDYTCQGKNCGARSGKGNKVVLHADYVKPFSQFPELRFEVSNGRTLCEPCQRDTDTYAGKLKLIPQA